MATYLILKEILCSYAYLKSQSLILRSNDGGVQASVSTHIPRAKPTTAAHAAKFGTYISP
jgi:hypothetical protein